MNPNESLKGAINKILKAYELTGKTKQRKKCLQKGNENKIFDGMYVIKFNFGSKYASK